MIEKSNIDMEDISKICWLIQKITDLDVEFIDETQEPKLQLINTKFPIILEHSKIQHYLSIHEHLSDKSPKYFYYYTNTFHLSYISVGIWHDSIYKGAIIVGPFLSTIPNDKFINNIIHKNQLPIHIRLKLQEFLKSLTNIDPDDYKNIGNLIINLCANKFIDGQAIFSDDIRTNINIQRNLKEEKDSDNIIEMRYKIEKELLHAIEKGSTEDAIKIWGRYEFNGTYRVPNNPLRAFKNLAYTSNSTFRIAAERGGLHPVYIHSISDKFAIQIEKTTNLSELHNLQLTMVTEYCDAVKTLSSKGYSPLVQKAINNINFYFSNPICLKSVAENIHVNPSHLSKKFKKETNMTITEFINERRIDEAKFLIGQGNNLITDIAILVGFNNHNYFCRVFKKVTSLTPSEYIMKITTK
ncbi:AraC family transcriptional regulator [Clostridium sediminicola]|uniref:helix-turn-helix transcriptional regulator n=1 Tax=Clostridium sediminicola TaxID=3114879 RepID=UPI0031F26B10